MSNNQHEIINNEEFYDDIFNRTHLQKQKIENKTFENCQFQDCDFTESLFHSCKFIDCTFKSSNLSNIKLNYSAFNDVTFDQCKLIGVNWTEAKWPNIALTSPIKFYQCDLSHSSFYELKLTELVLQRSKAKQVDFRVADLSHSDFTQTDLEGSLFMHTNLSHADFTDAFNYAISPIDNKIKKAKFSLPDAMNLLQAFDIEIVE